MITINLKLIACKVMQREFSLISSKCQNYIDISYIRQGYHNEPEKLKKILQQEIDNVDSNDDTHTCADKKFDAILLGYGLCSNGIVGISSKKHTIVVPKAHDCITLLLGSKEKYKKYFDMHSGGVYWYSSGWIENAPMPSKERYLNLYNEYVENFGEDNAQYLIELEQSWMTEYSLCTYINWKDLNFQNYIDYTKECADYLKWNFDLLEGNSSLINDFLDGNWSHDKFIVVPPNNEIIQSYDEDIIAFKPNA